MNPADLILSILRFALNSVLASLTIDPQRDVEDLKSEREAAAAMLTQLNPRDAIQAALAARAVTAHHASMECFRRAARLEGTDVMFRQLMATGSALSRQSEQLIKTLEQRQGIVRTGKPANPLDAAFAAAASMVKPQPVAPAGSASPAPAAGGATASPPAPVAQDPIHQTRAATGTPPHAGVQKPMHQSGATNRVASPAASPAPAPARQNGPMQQDIAAVMAKIGSVVNSAA
jgi:hypothetical protein